MKHADTVIVGAGAAGSVIAARMTESPAHSVLLIEAGPDYPNDAHLPSDLRDGTRNSLHDHDWGLRHKVNSRALFRFPLPRGRVVGGSSQVNTCIALRGVPSDYDEWASMGLTEWSWDRCLPAFIRLESDFDVRDEWHGADGPVPIRRHTRDELVPWQAAFVDGCQALGLPRVTDHNHPDASGYGPLPMNKIHGERMGAARCYLTASVRARESLRVLPHTVVRRVLFENKRVVGVEVETRGAVRRIGATRVVLCAGAIATPGILLRSGIGSRDRLRAIGVELVHDQPAVAARLLDHPGAAFFLWPKRGVSELSHPLLQTALRFRSREGEHNNDLQVQPGSAVPLPFISLPLVSVMCHVGKPRGHGTLTFTSASADVLPVVHSRLLDDPHDRALAAEALTMAFELSQTAPMRSLARVFYPSIRTLSDKTRLDQSLRGVCDSGYHPCGTAPMGTHPSNSVTDPHGRVWDIEGLYVADASLMPTIPTANIHLPTLMIGERIGGWLRDGKRA